MGMIDIGEKTSTKREAIAEGAILLKPGIIKLIKDNKIPKGDVLESARLAGILAAKKTPELIPLCHPISIECVDIRFSFVKDGTIKIAATIRGEAKTGFEMEALTAVSIAALTIYDMCKMFDKDMVISEIRLLKKSGGKSGTYVRRD